MLLGSSTALKDGLKLTLGVSPSLGQLTNIIVIFPNISDYFMKDYIVF